jgi:Fe-S cluster assembly protein SufD
MIDTINLKKILSEEKDNKVKQIKNAAHNGLKKSLDSYNEEYKYTPLLRKIEKEFKTLSPTISKDINLDKYSQHIPHNDRYYIVVINGYFQEILSKKPKELIISKYDTLNDNIKDIFSDTYSKYDDSDKDFFSSTNTINHNECLAFYIEKDISIKEKISIINIIDSPNPVYYRKCFIINKHSDVSFSEVFINTSDKTSFSNSVTEIYLDKNSKLNYYSVQNMNKNFHYNSINVFQKQNSISNFHTYSFTGEIIRNNLNIKLEDKNCYANMYGFYAIKKNSLIDNHTSVDHKDENSMSNEHYKGIIDKGSNGVFNGKIFVRQKAQKTNAFQSNNNILLSDDAKVNTKPQLEIWADDVKCSHGCTVGQLDEEALFYLMSRGISKKDSISLLLSAFSTEITEKIENEEIKEKYEAMILNELEGLSHE